METTIAKQRKLVSRTRRQRGRRGLVVDEHRRQEQEEEEEQEEQSPTPVTPPSRRSTAPRRVGDVKPLSHQEAIAQRINVQVESLNTWHEGVRGPLRSAAPASPPTPPVDQPPRRNLLAEELEENRRLLARMREQGRQLEQQQQQRGYGSQPPAFPVSRAVEDRMLAQGQELVAEARRQAAEAWNRETAARLNTTNVSMAGVNAAARAAHDAVERGREAESRVLAGTIAVTPEELARDFRFLGFAQENNQQRQAAIPCNDPEDDIEDVDDSMLPRPPASEAPRRFGQGFFEFPARLSEFVSVPILVHSDGETDSDDDDVPEPEDQEEEGAVSTVTMTGRYLTSDREMYEVAQESDWNRLCAQDYVYRGRVDDQQEQPVHAVVPINERFMRAVHTMEEQRDGGDTDSAMANSRIAPHVAFRRYAMPAPAEEAEADSRPGVTVDRERIAAAVRRMAEQQSAADRLYGQPPLPAAEANARAALAVYNRAMSPAATARIVNREEFERTLNETATLGLIPRAETSLAAARRRLREQQEPRMNSLYGMLGSGSGTTVYPETDLCDVLASTTSSSNNIWSQAGPAPVPATPQLLSLK